MTRVDDFRGIVLTARLLKKNFGGIAQLVERVVRNDEAWGSNPHTSTTSGGKPESKAVCDRVRRRRT